MNPAAAGAALEGIMQESSAGKGMSACVGLNVFNACLRPVLTPNRMRRGDPTRNPRVTPWAAPLLTWL